jgi:hypothetical protein
MLAAVVDIKRWLREDRYTPYIDRLNRDREIGGSLSMAADHQRLLAWWSRISADLDGRALGPGERLVNLRRVATAALFAVGVALGLGLGGFAFGYRGGYPVNLLALLGVLVGVPSIMLITTIVFLPGHIPGLSSVQDAFSGVNPGRWAGALLDRVAGSELFAAFGNHRTGSAFARWQLAIFSQWLAVGFFVGVLVIAWLLVVFTDLAFGWSTTLQVDTTDVAGWFSALASPWAAWLPVAAPNLELVEASRFYRLESAGMSATRVVQLGQWWPFVLMAIITYGLLPRLALLAVGAWRLQAATRSLLRDDAEVTALLDRLNTPRVSYESQPESAQIAQTAGVPAAPSLPLNDSTGVVIWNDALSVAGVGEWLRSLLDIAGPRPLALSVLQDAVEQQALLSALARDVQRLVIFTKGWEPPMLEFTDFLDLVRELFGPKVSLTVVPVDVTRCEVRYDEREIWAKALARQRDPRLYVVEANSVLAPS